MLIEVTQDERHEIIIALDVQAQRRRNQARRANQPSARQESLEVSARRLQALSYRVANGIPLGAPVGYGSDHERPVTREQSDYSADLLRDSSGHTEDRAREVFPT